MELTSEKVKAIYNGKTGKKYDMSMSHFFGRLKKKAFEASSLKKGDRVLVFCCGTGLDFPYIQSRIGTGGSIIGIDFSSQMLDKASEMVASYGWENVDLIQDDVTDFKNKLDFKTDAGICTLGLSIIPNFKEAYDNLLSTIKENGELIIGDMKLATGWQARFNPLTIFFAKRFGGTLEGHENSLEIISKMNQELTDVTYRDFFMGAYYICKGRKKKVTSNNRIIKPTYKSQL